VGRFLKDLRFWFWHSASLPPLFAAQESVNRRRAADHWPDPREQPAQVLLYEERLAGGQRVVFARDAHGVNSIAFDFGASLFEAGHQYPWFSTPALLTRT